MKSTFIGRGKMNQNDYSRSDWLKLHNRVAGNYKADEWNREVLFGAAKLRKRLFQHATGRVLDIGCGYGMNFPYLKNAAHITGMDFSPVMLNMARSYTRDLGIDIDLREGDAEKLEFPENTFDTVISALATCSFYDPIQALKEMQRVCKPEGKILLFEHGRSSWEWIGKYQDNHAHAMREQGACRWNQEPQELVAQAGLKILSSERTLLGIFHTMIVAPNKGM